MTSTINGLGAGIDLSSLVANLMNAERAPEKQMSALKLSALSAQSAWADLSTRTKALQTAAASLDTLVKAQGSSATSSDPTVLIATAAQGAQLGQIGIKVDHLATSQLMTSGALSSGSMLVGTGTALVSSGLAAVGASHVAIDGTVVAGSHTITVTQASGSATAVGTTGPALSYAAPGNDLTITLADGISHAVTLGTYADSAALVSDLNTQLGGAATASIVAGQLRLASRDQGSAATLTLGGGAVSALGLSTSTNGTDALVSVDGAAATAISHLDGTAAVTLSGGFTLTATGPLLRGTIQTSVVQTTDATTLADLGGLLSASGSPVGASLVDTGDGSANPFRFVLSATKTGTAGALTIDSSGINVLGTGQLTTITGAVDAQLQMGGATITRSSNSISDLLPGVTLNLLTPTAPTGSPTTVTVARDVAGAAKNAQSLVDALNGVINGVKTQTAYDATNKRGGPLSGDGGARSLSDSILNLVSGAAGTGVTKVLSQLGIQTTRDGTLTFDSAAFTTASQSDPDGVANLLSTFSKSVEDYAKAQVDVSGIITTGSAAAGSEIHARQDQIDAFEVRMTALNNAYTARYAALDAMLGKLKQQQAQLASQISGMPVG
jgi:flagellar hook-associated protein 2